MPFFFVVTNALGASIVEATKVVKSPADLVFYAEGKARRAFPRRDVLFFQQCEHLKEALALLDQFNGEGGFVAEL